MQVVIIGCGRAGAALAHRLDIEGDTVGVIDVDPAARLRLPPRFRGRFVHADGMHTEALEKAGIDRTDALAALSGNDSLNVVIMRIARERYRVPHVVGRLHDTDAAPVCADLGLAMVTSVRMTVDRVHRMLRHRRLEPEHTFGNGESLLVRSGVPDYLAGRHVHELDVAGEIQVVEVTRAGHSLIPAPGSRLRNGDLVSFVVAAGSLERLRGFVGGRLT